MREHFLWTGASASSHTVEIFELAIAIASSLPSPTLRSPSGLLGDMRKDTKKKNPAAPPAIRKQAAPTPNTKQRQKSILESLGVLALARPAPPPPPLLLSGQQRSLDGLAKIVKKNRDERPCDVLSRCLTTLEAYQRAVGGGEGATPMATAGDAAPAASTSTSTSTATASEDQARSALRELSCVRVDASLIAASGAGVSLRRFRKDPLVAVALSVQAEKILQNWTEAVTSEVRARRRYKAHAAAAAAAGASAAASAAGGGSAAAASKGKAATPTGA